MWIIRETSSRICEIQNFLNGYILPTMFVLKIFFCLRLASSLDKKQFHFANKKFLFSFWTEIMKVAKYDINVYANILFLTHVLYSFFKIEKMIFITTDIFVPFFLFFFTSLDSSLSILPCRFHYFILWNIIMS